jgi:dihydrofolate reductase
MAISLTLIAAMDRNRLIGRDNALPWRLPADLQHFKKNTLGKVVLMGRKTWESLPGPLPQRDCLVLSRNGNYVAEGAKVVASVDVARAYAVAQGAEELVIMGGENLYAQLIDQASKLILTEVDGSFEGDAWFPAFSKAEWREVTREVCRPDEKNRYDYAFVEYVRT